jgi:cystathionine gamma-lyase
MPGEAVAEGYTRYGNPSLDGLERALGSLEEGRSVVFSSGMAAVAAVLFSVLRPGDVLVVQEGCYPGVVQIAQSDLPGVDLRVLPAGQLAEAAGDARMVWVETPANPRLEVVDIAAVARAASGLVAVDNTLATPVGQRPLSSGADLSVLSGTKGLAGHTDVLIGAVSARSDELADAVRGWRSRTGAIPGPFEAWLVHRSLATLALRMERAAANSAALAAMLRERGLEVFHPAEPPQPLVSFVLPSAEAASRFLGSLRLVAEATSFGGVHSSAERRARWGLDAVPEGFIRFSCGVEDPADLLADVAQALDAARTGSW